MFLAMLKKQVKSAVASGHQRHDKDTGSEEVQVALLSKRIDELSGHLKGNPKDQHSRTGLLKMVGKRRRLLTYLERNKPGIYEKTIRALGLKK